MTATVFVQMYHPALDNVRVECPQDAVDEYEARGWIVVDGNAPAPAATYLTPGTGDLRYLKLGDVGKSGTTTGDALSAAYVTPLVASVAWIGDSITANGVAVGAYGNSFRRTYGYMTWAAMRLGQSLSDLGNFGVPGERSDQIAARFGTALATGAGIVGLLAGTNDVIQGRTLSQAQASITTMLDAARAGGRLLVIGTVPPSNGLSSGQKTMLLDLNDWIRRLPATRGSSVLVVDFFRVLVDDAGLFDAAAVQADGIHPNSGGAARMGKLWAETVAPFLPDVDRLETSAANSSAALAIARANYLANPLLTGTTGTLAGGATGAVADAWSIRSLNGVGTIALAAGKVARTDGYPGEWQRLALTAGRAEFRRSLTTGLPPVGAKIRAQLEMSEDAGAAGITTHGLMLRIYAPGFASVLAETYDAYLDSDTWPAEDPITDGALMTPDLTIPAGAGVLEVSYLFGAASGSPSRTVRLSRCSAPLVP